MDFEFHKVKTAEDRGHTDIRATSKTVRAEPTNDGTEAGRVLEGTVEISSNRIPNNNTGIPTQARNDVDLSGGRAGHLAGILGNSKSSLFTVFYDGDLLDDAFGGSEGGQHPATSGCGKDQYLVTKEFGNCRATAERSGAPTRNRNVVQYLGERESSGLCETNLLHGSTSGRRGEVTKAFVSQPRDTRGSHLLPRESRSQDRPLFHQRPRGRSTQHPNPRKSGAPLQKRERIFVWQSRRSQSGDLSGHDQGHSVPAARRFDYSSTSRGDGGAAIVSLQAHERANAPQIPRSRVVSDKPCRYVSPHDGSRPRFHSKIRRKTIVATGATMLLPLHTKDVNRLDWARCQELVGAHAHEYLIQWEQSVRFFMDEGAAKAAMVEQGRKYTAILSDEDVERLLARKLIVEVDRNIAPTCNTFSVPEQAKGRRRWIVVPVDLNAGTKTYILQDTSLFPRLRDIVDAVKAPTAACFDFAGYFHMFPCMHRAFTFKLMDGRTMAVTTVPTGARQPPIFSQILTCAIARAAAKDLTVHITAWIDNVRFAGEREQVIEASKRFRKICASIGIKLSEESEPTYMYNFLGIAFDHRTRRVEPAPKTKLKLQETLDELKRRNSFEWNELERFMGISMFAHTVVHASTEIYYVFKFMRRKARMVQDPLQQTQLWSAAKLQWMAWCKDLIATGRVISEARQPTVELYTDASDDGWGAIAFDGDGVRIVAGKWRNDQSVFSINMKELIAVRLAFSFIRFPPGAQMALKIDNTSVIGRLQRLVPTEDYRAHNEIHKIKTLSMATPIVSIAYIRSQDNLADYWSRLYSAV